MKKQNNRESGIAMLEAAIILAIVGAVAAFVLWIVSIIQTNKKIKQTQDDVADIALTVRALSLKYRDFSTLDGITNIEAGKNFLEKLRVATTTPFGKGSYYSVVYDPDYPDVFSIYIANLDSRYCKKLNDNFFRGSVGAGCGQTFANSQFVKSQQNVGVAVAINPNTGLNRIEDSFGIFYKKTENLI